MNEKKTNEQDSQSSQLDEDELQKLEKESTPHIVCKLLQ